MGATSNAVKDRWKAANYDFFRVSLPKGLKDRLKAVCEAEGVSMNSVFKDAAEAYVAEHEGQRINGR